MSLTSCLKKAGAAIHPEDRAAIIKASGVHRRAGLDNDAAAMKAVMDRIAFLQGEVQAESANAEAALTAARYQAGNALSKEQRKQVLGTLVDVYKAKDAQREMKGQDRNGNERYGYAHSPELFEKSDITGAMVRYYVTMPDGRRAHPSELFPNYTQSDIETELQRRESADRADADEQRRVEERADRMAMDTPQSAEELFRERNQGHWETDLRTGKKRTLVSFEKDGKFYAVTDDDTALIARLERAGWSEVTAASDTDVAGETMVDGAIDAPSLPATTDTDETTAPTDKPEATEATAVTDTKGTEDADAQFSRNGSGRGVPMADAEAVAAGIRAVMPNAPIIYLHESVTKAPKEVLEAIRKAGAEGDVEALYHYGKIHVFPRNLESVERMAFVVGHHEIRHHGLRSILGPRMGPLMLHLWAKNAKLQARAQQVMDDGHANTRTLAVEEALADMPVDEIAALSGWERIVAAVRQWLRDLSARLRKMQMPGLASLIEPTSWTDRDVAALVRRAEDVSRGGVARHRVSGTVFGRDDNKVWYSELRKQVMRAPMNSAPASGWQQYITSLTKNGVKPDEIAWSGIEDWLKLQTGKVTREAVAEYLDANGVQVTETVLGKTPYAQFVERMVSKYGQQWESYVSKAEADELDALPQDDQASESKYINYTLPGGTNYREVLLTLPQKWQMNSAEVRRLDNGRWGVFINGERSQTFADEWGAQRAAQFVEGSQQAVGLTYRSGHWDQTNVLAHIRINDRTDAEGKRVLFVEEIQSDWGQAAKKSGIREVQEARLADLTRQRDAAHGEERSAIQQQINDLGSSNPGVPKAPFIGKTDAWVALALKRVIKMAVDEGYDRVAFVTGEQSAERYDLSKQISRIEHDRWVGDSGSERWDIEAYDLNGNRVVERKGADASELENLVGKEIVKRIIEGDGKQSPRTDRKVLSGLDLKVGGEGMRAFYDKIVPSVAKDVLRKLGGGAMTAIALEDSTPVATQDRTTGRFFVTQDSPQFDTREEANAWARKQVAQQPAFDITPGMRVSAAKGLPLFSRKSRPQVTVSMTPDGWPEFSSDKVVIAFPQETERFEVIPEPGQKVLSYAIMPADSFNVLGYVELLVQDGKPVSLLDIEIVDKRGGVGRDTIEALLAANPTSDLNISNVVPAARGFWEKMGVPEQNVGSGDAYDGTLNWQTYAENTGAARSASQERAEPGGRSDTGREGARAGAEGQAEEALASRFSRANARAEGLRERLRQAGGGKKIIGDTGRYTDVQRQAMRDVGFEVEQPTLEQRAKTIWQDAGKKLAQGLFDQFAPVKELSQEAYGLLRLAKGAAGAFQVLLHGGRLKLNEGVYDFDEQHRGGVLQKLLVPLGGEHHDFFRWVAANRAERLLAEGKESLFTPESIAALKTLSDGVTGFDYTLQHGARAGQVTRDRTLVYADSLKTFNEFNTNVMDMAEQSGLIDGESRHLWEHEFYVPFYRVADEESGGIRGTNIKGGVVRQEAFKALKGGKQKLNADLLDNTLMNWAHLLDAAAKNRAAKATLEAAEDMGSAVSAPGSAAADMAKAMGKKSNVVWFMDQGQKRYFVVEDKMLMDAISSLEFAGLRSPVMTALGAFKHALTIGVTASPFFKVRNLIRDSVQAIATAPIGANPITNIAQGWKATDPKADAYFRLLAGGGTIHFGTMMEGSEAKRVQALVESGVSKADILDSPAKLKGMYRRFIEPAIAAYNELGNRGEAINRASLYEQLRKQGVGHAQASLMARDLMDFSMQGTFTWVRFLTQVVPFFNARIQGLYKLGRAAKEDPARFSAVIGAAAVASIGLMLAYGDDPDWKRREEWDRNNYWWFKFAGVAFRIPKPFEVGAIATLAERGFELAFDKEMTGKRFRKQVLTLLSDNLAMNPIPQVAKPILDVYANKGFNDRPIETMGMDKLQPDMRFTPNTTMAARGISIGLNAVAGLVGGQAYSPVQVDYLLKGYFGWLGTFVVQAGDILARPATGQKEKPDSDLLSAATGGMVSDLRDAPSRYVSQMYEQAKEIEQAYGTWKMLLKEGKVGEAAEFRADNAQLLGKHGAFERTKRGEAEINRQIKAVEQGSMSGGEKRERLRQLSAQREALARPLAPVSD